MGYFKHSVTCVVIEGWDRDRIDRIDEWLNGLPSQVLDLIVRKRTHVNNYVSYTMVPDGSKEGWEESETADLIRKQLVSYAPRNAVDVYFGGDEAETRGFNNDVPDRPQEE